MSAALKQFQEDVLTTLKDDDTSKQDKYYRILGALSEYKRSLPTDYIEAQMVWVITRSDGPMEGYTVFAVCGTYKIAEKIKVQLAARLTTPLNKFEITEIAFNSGHLWGILSQDDSFDVEDVALNNSKETRSK